jgi:hypothetical protein
VASYRYGLALVLTLVLVVFIIAAPTADWSRAIALALEGAALVVVVLTSRARAAARRERSLAIGAVTVLVLVLTAVGVVPDSVAALLLISASGALLVLITSGVIRLIRDQGVTIQAVAGALTVYLLLGLVFAWLMAITADVSTTPYFAQGTDGTLSKRLYFSFTVLTTTGFGDLTAGTALARAMAVLEMVLGQIYLVTVIGVLVGSFVGRTRRSAESDPG